MIQKSSFFYHQIVLSSNGHTISQTLYTYTCINTQLYARYEKLDCAIPMLYLWTNMPQCLLAAARPYLVHLWTCLWQIGENVLPEWSEVTQIIFGRPYIPITIVTATITAELWVRWEWHSVIKWCGVMPSTLIYIYHNNHSAHSQHFWSRLDILRSTNMPLWPCWLFV